MSVRTAYLSALALAVAAALFLAWVVLALGLVGVEGDPFDRLYVGVVAVGLAGAAIARFQAAGMAWAMAAAAIAQVLLTGLALALGKHQSPVTSIPELVGLNGMFVALFGLSAWLFRRAARRQP